MSLNIFYNLSAIDKTVSSLKVLLRSYVFNFTKTLGRSNLLKRDSRAQGRGTSQVR